MTADKPDAPVATTAGRFGLVGAACALLNVAIVHVGHDRLGWPYALAALATCVITIPLSYVAHARFTFAAQQEAAKAKFLRFVAQQLSQFMLGLAALAALVEGLGLPPTIAMVAVTGAMFVYGFVTNATWVFGAFGQRKARFQTAPSLPSLHVLQVSAFFAAHGGGIEAVADQLARRLSAAGARVHWMASGLRGETPTSLPPNLSIDAAPTWDPLEGRIGLPLPLWSLPALWRLWRAVGACNTLHVHDYIYLPTLLALLFARMRGKPVLLTQHVGEIVFASAAATRLLRMINRSVGVWALSNATQVTYVARPVMQHFAPRVAYRQPPLLVPNGVDHQRFHPGFDGAAGLTADGRVPLLFVGRFVEKKGLGLLRHAATLPRAAWRFIGWGPLGPHTWTPEERAAIEVIGRLPAVQIALHYQQAALLVLPSTGEGFPLVVQEALACGTPVLVSTEVLEAFPATDPNCVFDVELRCKDPGQALRMRLASLLSNPAQLSAGRLPAAALARQWDWQTTAATYLAAHGRLVAAAAA